MELKMGWDGGVWAKCPKCGEWCIPDNDQIHGRVSMICPFDCGYHETVDFSDDYAKTLSTKSDIEEVK